MWCGLLLKYGLSRMDEQFVFVRKLLFGEVRLSDGGLGSCGSGAMDELQCAAAVVGRCCKWAYSGRMKEALEELRWAEPFMLERAFLCGGNGGRDDVKGWIDASVAVWHEGRRMEFGL